MSFFQSRDGTQLHERIWPAAEGGAALGAVVIVHGYGEHIGRYDETARALAGAGFHVRGLDLRGHGLSGGGRGFCRRFDVYLDDVYGVVRGPRAGAGQAEGGADARAADLPLFLLGHSFGGLIGAHYALRFPDKLAGLVLTSPYWKLAMPVPPAKVLAGKIFSRLYPGMSLPTGLKGADVSRDPEIAAAYDVDPLNNKNATARWFTEAATAQEALWARAGELRVPLLLVVGAADKVASAPHAAALYQRIGSADKTLRMLDGQYHEVLNEPAAVRQSTVAEIVEWLRAHARAAEAKLRAGGASTIL
jgi:alpha-beta hydrolase superfamily lysophospholipase